MEKKIAAVTGASRGIGYAIARAFLASGYIVLLNAKNEEHLQEAAGHLRAEGLGAFAIVPGDIGKPETAVKIFEGLAALQGKYRTPHLIDVLINNAGISHVGLLQNMSDEEWHRLMGTNLDGVFYVCRMAIPAMLENKTGSILNISSVWGKVGASCEVAYSASKGAVNAFTRALAKELAPSRIAVNAIACGAIDTSMNGHLSEEEKRDLEEEIPAGRFGSPDEVARLCLQLADADPYLTGQVIRLDGGWI